MWQLLEQAQAKLAANPSDPKLVLECELVTPWAWREIDGRICIGMEGNLDTIHDATLIISGGFLRTVDGPEPQKLLAQYIVEQHNKMIG